MNCFVLKQRLYPEARAQVEALSYLKRFVRGMEDERLTKFLRFCTAGLLYGVR